MKKFLVLCSVFILVLISNYFIACNKHITEPIISKKDQQNLSKTTLSQSKNDSLSLKIVNSLNSDEKGKSKIDTLKIPIDTMIVAPNAMECTTMFVDVWRSDHYEPASNKIIGIWPREYRWTTNRISELHSKWGFNYIVSEPSHYGDAPNLGFPTSNIMMPVNPDNYIERMTTFNNNVWAYYLPEPKDNDNNWDVSLFYNQRNSSASNTILLMDG